MRYYRYRTRIRKRDADVFLGLLGLGLAISFGLLLIAISIQLAAVAVPLYLMALCLSRFWKLMNFNRWTALAAVLAIFILWGYLFGNPWQDKLGFLLTKYGNSWVTSIDLFYSKFPIQPKKIPLKWLQIYAWCIPPLALLLILLSRFKARFNKNKSQQKPYITDDGYVFYPAENDYEHRLVAKQILLRDLNEDEVVHHINGNPADNSLDNLCVMNSEKHEHWHAWLQWHKEKKGYYPKFEEQMKALKKQYDGIILSEV